MEKRTGRNWLRWMCAGLLSLSAMMNGGVQAEGVPPVIKYQAVLRDVEGNPMTERTGLAVRITLRQGSPGGDILYQETHTGLSTDAFGLLLLEIGRGQVANVGSASLSHVPWKNSPVYAQVEIQADDNGYTMMGASELLSVPYALYAGDAGVGFDLSDGFLPKYDEERGGLTNSGIYQSPSNEKITFIFEDGEYTFPNTRGQKGEVLKLMDDKGTLDWSVGGGGSGVDCSDCDDRKFIYWDATANKGQGALTSADLYYDDQSGDIYVERVEFNSRTSTHLEGDLKIDATVSGNNNLQYNDLPKYNVWVGGTDNKSKPHLLGLGVSIDSNDKDNPVLNFGGGVWQARSDAGNYYVYTSETDDAPNVRVGIGTGDTPKARFHMQGGSFLLSGDATGGFSDNVTFPAGNHFYWHSGKGALRMGELGGSSSLWDDLNVAAGSIALGTGAQATKADNVAIGKKAEALGEGAMVFGQTAQANGNTALALGTQIKVSGLNAIGIGSGYAGELSSASFRVDKAYGIGIGYDVVNEANNAIVIGKNNDVTEPEVNSIVLGTDNNKRAYGGQGGFNVTIGANNKTLATNSTLPVHHNVLIGTELSVTDGKMDIDLGYQNSIKGSDCIIIGRLNTIAQKSAENMGICIGYDNEIRSAADWSGAYGPMLLGFGLRTHGNMVDRGVFLGQYNAAENFADGGAVALVVGAGTDDVDAARKNALELSDKGELRIPGIAYAQGHLSPSDRTLKTDIQPLDADYTVLQALQPVRYRFKADEKQTLQFGFIAQDVETYFPHLVQTDGRGIKNLNYIGLLPVLWQYTQRLEQTVETQALEIDRLRTELESLKGDIQAIKAAMGIGE